MGLRTKLFVIFVPVMLVIAACGGSDSGVLESRRTPATSTPSASFREYRAYPTASRYSSPPDRSSGGARPNPPNGQPFVDTFFQDYGVNPFVAAEDERFSTFGMDVDTASYTISRSYIEDGHLPPTDAVRVEEFVNYFNGDYPTPRDTLQIYLDGARSRFGEDNKHLLRIGVVAHEISLEERKPVVLTFVIDVSGSMDRENRLGLAKRSLERLVDNLDRHDRVGIVVYGSRARIVLRPTSSKSEIFRAIRSLRAEGSTNAEAGLVMGYEMASDAFGEDENNRVILISDGVANTGKTAADAILKRIKDEANRRITLTAIGVGMSNYNDILMEQLANDGDGNYYYVDTDAEARKLFDSELVGLLEAVAMDAKIQVEFNPAVVDRYRLIGYENRSLETEDFRDDSVDAGEVGAGHSVTALYEVRIKDGALGRSQDGTLNEVAVVHIRYQDPDTREAIEHWREVTVEELDVPFERASPRFRFVASVAEFAEILRDSYWAREGTLEAVRQVASQAVNDMEATASDRELVSLVRSAINLRR